VLIAKPKTSLTATTKNISKLGVEPATPSLMLRRQMNEIGWMHNRCRMIVANFHQRLTD